MLLKLLFKKKFHFLLKDGFACKVFCWNSETSFLFQRNNLQFGFFYDSCEASLYATVKIENSNYRFVECPFLSENERKSLTEELSYIEKLNNVEPLLDVYKKYIILVLQMVSSN